MPLDGLGTAAQRGAGQVAYAGDFIGYWTHRLLFYRAEPWVFTVVYTARSAWRSWPRSSWRRPEGESNRLAAPPASLEQSACSGSTHMIVNSSPNSRFRVSCKEK